MDFFERSPDDPKIHGTKTCMGLWTTQVAPFWQENKDSNYQTMPNTRLTVVLAQRKAMAMATTSGLTKPF